MILHVFPLDHCIFFLHSIACSPSRPLYFPFLSIACSFFFLHRCISYFMVLHFLPPIHCIFLPYSVLHVLLPLLNISAFLPGVFFLQCIMYFSIYCTAFLSSCYYMYMLSFLQLILFSSFMVLHVLILPGHCIFSHSIAFSPSQ